MQVPVVAQEVPRGVVVRADKEMHIHQIGESPVGVNTQFALTRVGAKQPKEVAIPYGDLVALRLVVAIVVVAEQSEVMLSQCFQQEREVD